MANDYPRMLYKEDGSTITVDDLAGQEEAVSRGFSFQPFDIHREVKSNVPVNSLAKPRIESSPSDPFGLGDFMEKLLDRMREEFFSDPPVDNQSEPNKPRRGRPPKDRSASSEQD